MTELTGDALVVAASAPLPPAPLPPPHPLDGLWLVRMSGETYGPYTGHAIKAYLAEGRLVSDSEVSRDPNGVAWRLLSDDPALAGLIKPVRGGTALAVPRASAAGSVSVREQMPEEGSVVVQINQTFSHGSNANARSDIGPRNPLLAGVLSLLVPGFGQFYNNRPVRGFLFFCAMAVLWLFYLGWLMNVLAAAEAYLDAQNLTVKFHDRDGTRPLGGRVS